MLISDNCFITSWAFFLAASLSSCLTSTLRQKEINPNIFSSALLKVFKDFLRRTLNLRILRVNAIFFCLAFLADYFNKGNNDLDNSELRLDTCLLLWKQVKSETEVSIAFNVNWEMDFMSVQEVSREPSK